MPNAPQKHCSYFNCPVMVDYGRCVDHTKQVNHDYNATRDKDVQALYQSPRWRKASLAYRKANPLCVLCLAQGRTVSVEHVDHIIPISQGGAMFDPANWQSLCKSCHTSKTNIESKDAKVSNSGAARNPCGTRGMGG